MTDANVASQAVEPADSSERAASQVRRATLLAAAVLMGHAGLGLLRHGMYRNETFDLAFYSRMAWGMSRGDLWDPILGAHVFGLHVSPVLVPLGWLGALFGTPEVLLLAQGVSAVLAARVLARLGAHALGSLGAYVGALGLALHPNVGHVLAYEAHPGTLALWPLALLAEAVVMREGRKLLVATALLLSCREDLALAAMLASGVSLVTDRPSRRWALAALGLATSVLLLFALVLHPAFKPATGSLEAHFGPWGSSMREIVLAFVTEPGRVLAHLATPARLSYLPRVLFPLAFLPLLSPRMLLLASPVLAVALLSHFPTTTRIDSHYLTPALPFLVAGAVEGARRVRAAPHRACRAALAFSVLAYAAFGLLSPAGLAPRFPASGPDRAALSTLLARIPEDASVEAPDPLLSHLAERRMLHRRDGFAGDDEAIVLDLAHRQRFAGTEDLLRTTEEPAVRSLLARPDRFADARAGQYLLVLRDRPSRDPFAAYRAQGTAPESVRLAACLGLVEARRRAGQLELEWLAHGPCATDLALRLEDDGGARRVDLLFDGLVSPSRLRDGDRVVSRHAPLGPRATHLALGLLRSSGARVEATDPLATTVPLADRR